ncbi:MAG: hypothetical protein KAT70_03570, partial [Thermoplasmata archaeon]|nr:hypothetical protein [Thermoplasmata archaeon]
MKQVLAYAIVLLFCVSSISMPSMASSREPDAIAGCEAWTEGDHWEQSLHVRVEMADGSNLETRISTHPHLPDSPQAVVVDGTAYCIFVDISTRRHDTYITISEDGEEWTQPALAGGEEPVLLDMGNGVSVLSVNPMDHGLLSASMNGRDVVFTTITSSYMTDFVVAEMGGTFGVYFAA